MTGWIFVLLGAGCVVYAPFLGKRIGAGSYSAARWASTIFAVCLGIVIIVLGVLTIVGILHPHG